MAETPEFVMALDDISASILALENQIALKQQQLEMQQLTVNFLEMEAKRVGVLSKEARNADERKVTENSFLEQHDSYRDRVADIPRLKRSIEDLKAQKRFEQRSYDLLFSSEFKK